MKRGVKYRVNLELSYLELLEIAKKFDISEENIEVKKGFKKSGFLKPSSILEMAKQGKLYDELRESIDIPSKIKRIYIKILKNQKKISDFKSFKSRIENLILENYDIEFLKKIQNESRKNKKSKTKKYVKKIEMLENNYDPSKYIEIINLFGEKLNEMNEKEGREREKWRKWKKE